MDDSYLYVIVALLPLSALMLIIQANPYSALVVRGILGAVAALVYVVLGAADVALTEALVGTMLAITLYAVAVRSSLVMRIGVLKDNWSEADAAHPCTGLIADFRTVARKYHLRLELLPYPDPESLQEALLDKAVHLTCIPRSQPLAPDSTLSEPPYYTAVRVRRLYDILEAELTSPATSLTYVAVSSAGEKH
ncbi:DUF4040 domain-containing protein [Pantanalinema rosaneae CENA516]|uniref:DUF4040 domain-containing protein n=1 Tax=Pantanalinema rosaneae TaxID=1620701 RepID=UPI003D6FFDFD